MLLRLSKKFYEREAVFLAAYKFTNKCAVLIEPIENDYVGVFFETKAGCTSKDLKLICTNFCNEVLDQQVRLDLEKRFGDLRKLIVQHAFQPIEKLRVK